VPTVHFPSSARGHRYRVGIVSTYPPQVCGLATFAAALGGSLAATGHTVEIVRLLDGTPDALPARLPVIGDIVHGDVRSLHRAARRLSLCDTVIVQHEFGIYGGDDGCEVLDLVDAIAAPVLTVLHTVPTNPTPNQHRIIAALCERSAAVVVMSAAAHQRLLDQYPVDAARLAVIPHGAVTTSITSRSDHERARTHAAPQLLTWGLIGPGKGIEHVIDAMGLLHHVCPMPHYTVAGVTHPKVLAGSGDGYRQSLVQRAARNGLADHVHFDASYRDVATLTRFIASAAVVVLPYDSREQVTSGVLVDSLAAGRPVIATAFPHAVELLSGGAGLVVPHDDQAALADAIRLVASEPDRLVAMSAAARRVAPTLSWSAVALSYVDRIDRFFAVQAAAAG